MMSKEKKPKPEVSRRNTFQRMLDMERKGELNRMQASTMPLQISRSSTSLAPTSSPNLSRMSSLHNTGRAMSTPSLSLNIPPPKFRTKYIIKDGDVVPEEEGDEDRDSETSSICHSPGWDDLMGSKRKKEKKEAKERKKEKEKTEAKALAKARTEAKHAEKLKNRLTKAAAPPTNKRLMILGIVMDRSRSVPEVPKNIEPDPPKENGKISDGSARRGIVEAGLKDFIQSTQAVPVLWRSSHGTPTETTLTETSTTQEAPVPYKRPTSTQDGFIGGLKLRLADEAKIEERIRARSIAEEPNADAIVTTTDKPPKIDLDNLNNHVRPGEEVHIETSVISYKESGRTPQQWESIYEQAARMMRSPESSQESVEEISTMDRNIKKTRNKTYPPTSYFPVDGDSPRSRRNSSIASNTRTTSRPRTSEDKDSAGRRASSAYSSERPSLNTRETSVERGTSTERGRGIRSYAGRQRKLSEDRDVSDEYRASEASGYGPESSSRGRRMSWTSIKSFNRNSSTDAPSTIKTSRKLSKDSTAARQKPKTPTADDPTLPPLQFAEQITTSPIEGSLLHRRTSSKVTVQSLKGFKSAAKAAFTRNSAAVTSPTGNVASPTEIQVANGGQPRQKKKASNIALAKDGKPLSKAERFFGQPVSTTFYEDPMDTLPNSSDRSSKHSSGGTDVMGRAKGRSISIDKNADEYSHSRSTTDSSEGYSTFDESSNVTTPMASKSNSHKDYFPRFREHDLVVEAAGNPKKVQYPAFMTNAMPLKGSEEHKLKPKNLPSQLPSRVSSLPSPSDPVQPSNAPIDLNRQPSLSRSLSNPELEQDLSFLPALKHQPLTKPTKEKELKKRKGKRSPLSQAQEPDNSKPTSLIKPEPLSPTLSKSESSSSMFPVSSQYLQNARLSLPRPPPRSGIPSPISGGPDPIAKMFVVCCSCKYYHDLPSKIYECMARSESIVEDKDLGVRGLVRTSVRCPWCNHGMTTACCAGYAAVVILREKLH